jgi:ATP-binding cassette subfamily B protein
LSGYKESAKASGLFVCALDLLVSLGIASLFWFGGVRILNGTVKVGVLITFTLYAQRFLRPIQNLSEKFSTLQTALASFEGIVKLLDESVPVPTSATPHDHCRLRGHIEFRNVWFGYRHPNGTGDVDWVLKDISFSIQPGETVAIVGHTGAGKTTIFQLLLRFYEVERGQILIDGIDICRFDPKDLRCHFGVVLQDPYLSTGTIESNVTLGTGRISAVQVEEALRQVGLGPLLARLPMGIYTTVDERGSTFSTGEKQLINVARALAHAPEILIFDEATSSVDGDTEHKIRETIEQYRGDRTSIVITHRLARIRGVDRILVLHKGRLAEAGTHECLLSAGGIYSRLYDLQHLTSGMPLQSLA